MKKALLKYAASLKYLHTGLLRSSKSDILRSPGRQAQHGGDVVLGGVVEIDGHVAVELLSPALLALFGQPHLLSNHRRGHDEQVTAGSASGGNTAAAAACVAASADRRLPLATPLLHVVAAERRSK